MNIKKLFTGKDEYETIIAGFKKAEDKLNALAARKAKHVDDFKVKVDAALEKLYAARADKERAEVAAQRINELTA